MKDISAASLSEESLLIISPLIRPVLELRMLLETLTVLLTLSLGSGLRLGVKEPHTTGKEFPEQFVIT